MTDHLEELRFFMEASKFLCEQVNQEIVPEPVYEEEIISSELDDILDDLEKIKFKITNSKLPDGNADFIEGYEVARMAIEDMIDRVIEKYKV